MHNFVSAIVGVVAAKVSREFVGWTIGLCVCVWFALSRSVGRHNFGKRSAAIILFGKHVSGEKEGKGFLL